MPKKVPALIKPIMLIWAREYAYLNLAEASKRLRITSDKLKAWEDGIEVPTVNQLHEIARVYRQPFAVFYLTNPPVSPKLSVKDYRRIPGEGFQQISPELAHEIRIAHYRKDLFIELFLEIGKQPPDLSMVLNINDKPDISAENIRKLLGISVREQKTWKDSRIAFNKWRESIENIGVLVFQSAQYPTNVARGFSLGEVPLPIIVVNRKDSYTGRIFTLFHELAHILIRTSGICEVDPDIVLPPEEQRIEVFCNKIAAEVLMPRQEFLNEYHSTLLENVKPEMLDIKINYLASQFCISREATIRRMVTLGLVSEQFYKDKRVELLNVYRKNERSSGYVTPVVNVISQTGKPYVRAVLQAYDNNKITLSDVSNYLGLRIKHIKRVGELVGVR